MARFSVYRERWNDQLFVDCQADRLSHLKTRFVIPLLALDTFDGVIDALNPEVTVLGKRMVLGTQFAFTIPLSELHGAVDVLVDEDHRIIHALDVLIGTA